MRENAINSQITEVVKYQLDGDGNFLIHGPEVHFQQDGAPTNYVLPVRHWMDMNFQIDG